MAKTEIGRKLERSESEPVLNRGVTFAIFHKSGKIAEVIDLRQNGRDSCRSYFKKISINSIQPSGFRYRQMVKTI